MEKTIRYYSQVDNEMERERSSNKKISTNSVIFDVTRVKENHYRRRKLGRRNEEKSLNDTKNIKTYRKKVKLPKEQLSKVAALNINNVKTRVHRKRVELKENVVKQTTEQAAKTNILLTEEAGYLEAGEGETTGQFTQKQILDSIDVAAAAKTFELRLEFGPYHSKYSRNGRHLLIGGKMGHVAAFDWVTKKLHCEINIMESVHDVCWLHMETMFAIAQKKWVYMYDQQGIELHCIKKLNAVTRMEFLPHHFLLATCSDNGYLSWLDVSIGQVISQYNTDLGQLSILAQNPWNATLCLGHVKGVVSLWAPKSREPLAKILCHKAPITALHVDPTGTYMASAANNRDLKIWDIRKLEGPVQDFKLVTAANNLAFSQRKFLAVGMENFVQIYKDWNHTLEKKAYMRHSFPTAVSNFDFCPYEDVLGVSTTKGFISLLVPGAGEPNFDSLEANPYQSKSQRQESEVKALLEKIQPDMITLNPTTINDVDIPTLRDKLEAKKEWIHLKSRQSSCEFRKNAKGKGASIKIARNKELMQQEEKSQFVIEKCAFPNDGKSSGVLNRFLSTK